MPQVNVIGSISGASHLPSGAQSAYCRWQLVAGPSWTVLEGLGSGQTQNALVDRTLGGAGLIFSPTGEAVDASWRSASVVWEHPLDLFLSTTSLTGWPQLQVAVWQQDELQRNEIVGYGSALVPVAPGQHRLEIATWRPEGTALQELRASYLGGGLPQLMDTRCVTNPAEASRTGLATTTTATVEVEIQVLARGFEGVVLSS
jgi:B9 domain-containing protein 2